MPEIDGTTRSLIRSIMDHRNCSPYERRVFMDNRYYRSTPTPSGNFGASAVCSLAPRHSPSALRSDQEQIGCFNDFYDNERDPRSRLPYRRGFDGYLKSRLSGEEIVRRFVKCSLARGRH